jgi:hypothetical protein
MLSCVPGVTTECAALILAEVQMGSIAKCDYESAAVANVKKPNGRRVGKAIEARLRQVFASVCPSVDEAAPGDDTKESIDAAGQGMESS